jgi:hypothetical protein
MAKGQVRSNKEKRKPKANANKKKSAGLNPTQAEPAPSQTAEPSEMYKLFTKGRGLA